MAVARQADQRAQQGVEQRQASSHNARIVFSRTSSGRKAVLRGLVEDLPPPLGWGCPDCVRRLLAYRRDRLPSWINLDIANQVRTVYMAGFAVDRKMLWRLLE
jgi:hypothetical protein